ncbi:putative redoxin [Lyophyllum shimeji]|uniref:Putative peroxiredoxin n=1 Tax=Lyophyllum shimeji TaxID=47721 RepID=A0A9P3UR33_LYOSH|nr:putative redoxin [Lyophyllum shimeji]
MASIKVGETLPQGTFTYIPYTPELENNLVCGVPSKLSTDEWKGKKVVLFSVPGAFTPTCHAKHLPPYVEKYEEFKAKGVDVVAVLASNDAFVMSGWGRFEGVKDKILTLSDTGAEWAKPLGLSLEFGGVTRVKRFAMILDDLKVTYFEVEPAPGAVTVSGAEAVLEKL